MMNRLKLIDWVMGYLIVVALIMAVLLALGFVSAVMAQPMGDLECSNPNTNIQHAKKQEDFVSARRFTAAEVKSIKEFIVRSHYNVDVRDLSTIDTIVVIYFKEVGVVLYGGGGKVCHYVAGLPDTLSGFVKEALGQGV